MGLEIIAQVGTSALAFGIFYWTLKTYAFPSLIKVQEDRQYRIKAEFDRIDALQAEVDALRDDYNKRIAAIEAEAREKINEAIASGKQIAEEIQEKARLESAAETERNRQALQLEVEKLRIELKQKVVALSISATEKILREKLTDKKNKALVDEFIEKGLAQQ
jgi:F-type H+-transporting ATPase subunit b